MKRMSCRDRNTLKAIYHLGEADRFLLHTWNTTENDARKIPVKDTRATIKTLVETLQKTIGIPNAASAR